jgi:hypothetical protein
VSFLKYVYKTLGFSLEELALPLQDTVSSLIPNEAGVKNLSLFERLASCFPLAEWPKKSELEAKFRDPKILQNICEMSINRLFKYSFPFFGARSQLMAAENIAKANFCLEPLSIFNKRKEPDSSNDNDVEPELKAQKVVTESPFLFAPE